MYFKKKNKYPYISQNKHFPTQHGAIFLHNVDTGRFLCGTNYIFLYLSSVFFFTRLRHPHPWLKKIGCQLYALKVRTSLNCYNLQFRSRCNYVSENTGRRCPWFFLPVTLTTDCQLPRQEKWATLSAEFSLGARTIFLPFFLALPTDSPAVFAVRLSVFPLLCNWLLPQNHIDVLQLLLTARSPYFPPSGSTGGGRI